MITLADFQNYLSKKAPLSQLQHSQSAPIYINDDATSEQEQLLRWAASLSAQTQTQQVMQLEQILTELTVAELEDKKRLQLLSVVMSAADRLITVLHKHYNHELGALNDEQLLYINQAKSLYYLIILAHDGIIQRTSLALNAQQEQQSIHGWQRLLTLAKTPPLTLGAAIYQSLIAYQKLLYEHDLSYQPSLHLWSAFNRLYYLACQVGVAHNDLSMQVVTKQAPSIHKLYVQICLHSLLNVRAMHRSDILLVQRLLPLWSIHISATYELQTSTRIFVDLQSKGPPEYLSAQSTINPYEEHQRCLFVDLKPLAAYLYQRQQALLNSHDEAVEYQLISKVFMTIQHRYIDRQTTLPTRYSPKQRATIISGFNNIHYEVAGKRGLMSMIAAKELAAAQLPRQDTQPKNRVIDTLSVETFDSTDTVSPFRALYLLPTSDASAQKTTDNKTSAPCADTQISDATLANIDNDDSDLKAGLGDELVMDNNINTAPPPLPLMSLFLLCRSAHNSELKWSLGMVRWLNFEHRYTEVEWQVLGHVLTACALRLDNRDQRSQHFVPALMVAGDQALQTAFTIIVPPYHFKPNDKVMLRIDDKQENLRLQECLINSRVFNQYKVMQL
ncbi:hypothetical protein [uncultured Psychrobacter sp.]|uniref:hypothetical protein n=1 Tax=uncultured Psychrobacter sp. TaxID=259303 RepID=UPI003459DC43